MIEWMAISVVVGFLIILVIFVMYLKRKYTSNPMHEADFYEKTGFSESFLNMQSGSEDSIMTNYKEVLE